MVRKRSPVLVFLLALLHRPQPGGWDYTDTGCQKESALERGFYSLSFPAFKPGKQSRCHKSHTSCIRTHGLTLDLERHTCQAGGQAMCNTSMGLSVGHPPHPSPTGPGTSEIPWLWPGETGKKCMLWVRIWQKIEFWKFQAACSSMAMYSGTGWMLYLCVQPAQVSTQTLLGFNWSFPGILYQLYQEGKTFDKH